MLSLLESVASAEEGGRDDLDEEEGPVVKKKLRRRPAGSGLSAKERMAEMRARRGDGATSASTHGGSRRGTGSKLGANRVLKRPAAARRSRGHAKRIVKQLNKLKADCASSFAPSARPFVRAPVRSLRPAPARALDRFRAHGRSPARALARPIARTRWPVRLFARPPSRSRTPGSSLARFRWHARPSSAR